MSTLKLFLLGSPRIEYADTLVAIKRRKALALLAYLAVAGQPQRRDTLAALLWPGSGQHAARQALRRDLSDLNLALGSQWLEADREQVGLRTGFWLDVDPFQRHLDECAATPALCPRHLEDAVALYRGDFLAGFTLTDAPAFDEWQFFQTETLRQACATAIERLVLLLGEQGAPEAAIPHARRWLALDPLHEPAHRQLMRLYVQAGQHAAALRQYERCREILHNELGVPPAPETTLLYDQIRERQAQPGALAPPRPASMRAPRHNLPTQTTPFIGREPELAEIRRLLLDEPDCRLLNLLGPGGIGKTRLALAAAAPTVDAFPDGVSFVSLAPVHEAADIVPAIAEALRFTFHGQSDPKEQLLDYLSQKQMLLIIDNVEHLLDGIDLLSAIVRHTAAISVLTTSRERLHLPEEWLYEVHGLPFPAANDATGAVSGLPAGLDAYAAVQLFLQRARQVQTSFAPAVDEMAEIARICQLVEGMPLGLELAAPWVRSLSCREIVAEIEQSLDFLTSSLRAAPERHRSLRVVFEQTWVRLSPTEQAALMRLSVFRGGCTREAAEAVAGATLPVLSSLVDKALLRRTNLGRYELHELIRQFAETQLQTDRQTTEQTRQCHQEYFITFLERRTAGVKGGRQKETVAEIKADMDNVRLAWRRAMAQRDAQALARSAECLFVFYMYSSGHYEGQIAFRQAAAAFCTDSETPTADRTPGELVIVDGQENLVGFLLSIQAYFLARTSGGQAHSEQMITRLLQAEPGDRRMEAIARAFLSFALLYSGKFAESRALAEAGLALASDTGELLAEAWLLMALGSPGVHGRPAEAERFLQRLWMVCNKSGDPSARGLAAQNLGAVLVELGRYEEAAHYIEQAIRVCAELESPQGLGYAHFRAGQLAIAQGNYQQAIESFRQALAYYAETRSSLHAGYSQIWLGFALRRQGDHDQAKQTLQQTLETFTAINDRLHVAYCLLGLGSLAQDQGDLAQAEQLQREALAIWRQMGEEARVADASRYLGHLMIAAGEQRHPEARQSFRQALELGTKHQMAPVVLDVCVGVARLLALAGETERAVELLALPKQHESSTFETRKQARQLLRELVDQLQPEAARAAQARGQAVELWAGAQLLLAELAADHASSDTSRLVDSTVPEDITVLGAGVMGRAAACHLMDEVAENLHKSAKSTV